MKTKIELKRINGDIIFSHECEDNSVAKTINALRISGAEFDLSGSDLSDADLSDADLIDADLSGSDLSGSDLSYANLSNANLSNAKLRYSDLRYTNLSDAKLRYSDLRYTNLSDADLIGSDLMGADLTGSYLGGSDFSGDYLSDIDVSVTTAFLLPQCPSEGSFVAWKKAGGMIVKLLVTEDARRSSATTLKCRCSKARVLKIEEIDSSESKLKEVASSRDANFVYRVGEIVEVKNFDDDRWNECGSGIHFFIAREMAVKY